MDHANLFLTKTTAGLLRLEFALAMTLSGVLLVWHWHAVNWVHALILFAYIDVIGYIPGAIAYRRRHGQAMPKAYYVLYNAMHNFTTGGLVTAIVWALNGPEWALLAIPLHLCGDRALFGNFYKSFSVSFEPVEHPAYAQLAAAVRPARPTATPPKPTPLTRSKELVR